MRKDKALLQDVLDGINAIESFVKGKNKEEFFENDLIQSAVVRKLEIIGEAVKNLSKESKKNHSKVPWKDIAGMRDKLIHAYFGINLERVWETINYSLPKFKDEITNILSEMKDA